MESLYAVNIKSFISFLHLSGIAFGVGGAWILDLYILNKLYRSPVTKENIQIINFVSKIVTVGLLILWFSGLSFIVFYYYFQPELLQNQKIWAKLTIVILLSLNGYFLHKYVLPVIVNNHGKILIRVISLKQLNALTLIGCISFVSWPLIMLLGAFSSINFRFTFIEIAGVYLLLLLLSLTVAFIIKGFLVENEMRRKIGILSKSLKASKQTTVTQARQIQVLSKVLKES